MGWQGELYFDKVLSFGLRSAPIIFTAVADGIEWIIWQRGVQNIFHYVDDFIIVGKPNTQECASALATTLQPSLSSVYPPNLKSVKALQPPSLY